jgi:hypothetical protein
MKNFHALLYHFDQKLKYLTQNKRMKKNDKITKLKESNNALLFTEIINKIMEYYNYKNNIITEKPYIECIIEKWCENQCLLNEEDTQYILIVRKEMKLLDHFITTNYQNQQQIQSIQSIINKKMK